MTVLNYVCLSFILGLSKDQHPSLMVYPSLITSNQVAISLTDCISASLSLLVSSGVKHANYDTSNALHCGLAFSVPLIASSRFIL